jgi:hypothetical protein
LNGNSPHFAIPGGNSSFGFLSGTGGLTHGTARGITPEAVACCPFSRLAWQLLLFSLKRLLLNLIRCLLLLKLILYFIYILEQSYNNQYAYLLKTMPCQRERLSAFIDLLLGNLSTILDFLFTLWAYRVFSVAA